MFFKMKFYFMLLSINVLFWCETGPIQKIFHQHCGYWWSDALAPGHQQPQWWVCTQASSCLWVKWLWPCDAIWCHRSGSTLAQVMTCCLTAPSHYLNQCWLSSSLLVHSPVAGFYTKGRPLVKSNLIRPSDKLSWQPGCPVLNINIQGNFSISQGSGSADNLLENLV